MQDANPVSMPLKKMVKLAIPTGSKDGPTINVSHTKAIGSIMYVALGTQPDIA